MMLFYRFFGRLLELILAPFAAPAGRPFHRMNWADRLTQRIDHRCDLWMHAASVGEVRMLEPLIGTLQANRRRLVLSVMTAAGAQEAVRRYGQSGSVTVILFPLDFPNKLAQLFDAATPRLLVIAETEIWPNLISEAALRALPIVLVNGRLTERAFGRYQLLGGTIGRLLGHYKKLFVKSPLDRDRFVALGAAEERIEVTGDLKAAGTIRQLTPDERQAFRAHHAILHDEFLLVAGSTRPGEEVLMLDWYLAARQRFPRLRLLLAPRHLERMNEVIAELKSRQLSVRLLPLEDTGDRLEQPDQTEGPVLLMNAMGHLTRWYGAADIACVGGTLVPIGGHNLFEPLQAGVPVLFGPSTFNVQEAASRIMAHRWGRQIESVDDLSGIVASMLNGEAPFASYQPDSGAESAATRISIYLEEQLRDA